MPPRRPLAWLAALVVAGLLSLSASPAAAATATTLTLTVAPHAGAVGAVVHLAATLAEESGPVAAQDVVLQRLEGETWTEVARASTDAQGRVGADVPLVEAGSGENRFRAVHEATPEHEAATSEVVVVTLTRDASLALAEPRAGYVDQDRTLVATLTSGDGAPVPGRDVVFERRQGGAWRSLARVSTNDSGVARTSVTPSLDRTRNVVRARFAGAPALAAATSPRRRLVLEPRRSRLEVDGPSQVVDEKSLDLRVHWATTSGLPISRTVRLYSRVAKGTWRPAGRVSLDDRGRGRITLSPRVDTRYRASGPGSYWYRADTSRAHAVDNLPPGKPVVFPAAAPHPTITLPPQPRATKPGAAGTISGISDARWRTMVGRTWHQGCPVARRAALRLVSVNYWGYDGYRHRGEIVVRDSVAKRVVGVFSSMYRGRFPIRAMYPEDRFGWSAKLQGADDYKSMRAGNTSAFNCRNVVGKPGVPRRTPTAARWTSTPGRTPTGRATAWSPTCGGRATPTRGSPGARAATRS